MAEALKCPNCGGNINRERMVCEYCGTQFKQDYNPYVVSVCKFEPKVDMLETRILLDDRAFEMMGREDASEYAIRMMAQKLADAVVPYMEVHQYFDPEKLQWNYQSRVRILRPDYRF